MTRQELEARIARYYEAVRALDTDAWVASFAADAVVEDPVGAPPVRGHAALRAFFGEVRKSFRVIDLREELVMAIPPEAAVRWTVRGETHGGLRADFPGISLFTFDATGVIRSMRVFWHEADVGRQFALAEVPARR